MRSVFDQFDFSRFWEESEYSTENYEEPAPTKEMVSKLEDFLGYKIPESYLELAGIKNGGELRRNCMRTSNPTSWANDHVNVSGIYAIGETASFSLGGEFTSQFWKEEWGYPDIGIYFADTESAGHEMICLDYTDCGPTGEPRIVHIDQEFDYEITVIADSFETFIKNLEPEDNFDLYV